MFAGEWWEFVVLIENTSYGSYINGMTYVLGNKNFKWAGRKMIENFLK